MAEGWSTTAANAALDTLLAAYPWIKAHLGAPGAAGTANAAAETGRRQATWAAAASGTASNSAALTWSSPTATETWTKFSAWTASSGGTFGFSGTITGGTVTQAVPFSIGIGDLDVTVTVAS